MGVTAGPFRRFGDARTSSAGPTPHPAVSFRAAAGSLTRVRLTEFWNRMRAQFGETYADSVARDHVLTVLGGRTVNQALADGEDAKTIWRAVCDTFNVPSQLR